jgi:hypothetical protein
VACAMPSMRRVRVREYMEWLGCGERECNVSSIRYQVSAPGLNLYIVSRVIRAVSRGEGRMSQEQGRTQDVTEPQVRESIALPKVVWRSW